MAPAPPGHGIRFLAQGCAGEPVPLSWQHRAPSRLNTALALPDGSRLRTIEHLAASLSAFDVDNALVTVRGREIPIFDGSARRWCACLSEVGVVRQPAPRRYIRVTDCVQLVIGERFIRIEPACDIEIDVTCEQIATGEMLRWQGVPTRDTFVDALSRSRSSGSIMKGVDIGLTEPLRRAGLLRQPAGRTRGPVDGANRARTDLVGGLRAEIIENLRDPSGEAVLHGARPWRAAIWFGPWVIGGRRYPDETVRHVALDLIGDLCLAGAPLLGRVVAHRPTHRLAYACVAMLMERPDAWEWWPGLPAAHDLTPSAQVGAAAFGDVAHASPANACDIAGSRAAQPIQPRFDHAEAGSGAGRACGDAAGV